MSATYRKPENGHVPVNGHPNGKIVGINEEKAESEVKHGCLKRTTNRIIWVLESWFAWLGRLVATHPFITIGICVLVVGLFAIGLIRFTETTDTDKLWVPQNAAVLTYKSWIETKFPSTTRIVTMIFVADNVLKASVVQSLNTVYTNSLSLTTSSGKNLTEICVKSGTNCRVSSILELWSYDDTTISSLTDNDVVTMANTANTANYRSPMYSNIYDITTQVGGRVTVASSIQSAKALKITWLLQGDDTVIKDSKSWESLAIDLAKKGQSGVSVYVYATRSFGDVAGETITADVQLLSVGYIVMIVFVTIILGRFNCTEHRIGLAFCGLLVIGLSIALSFSLSSAAGWEYGPLHSILPFLLLGIGVDDMFVIVAALGCLSHHQQELPIPERLSLMLKHAGVSITVTSLTDIVAFGIGATTVLPALKSFCVFAAIGVLGLYIFSTTFFVACICFDVRRREDKRNACLCCFKHSDEYKPNACSQRELIPLFLRKIYAAILLKLPVKIFVIIATAALLGVNIWGFYSLKQEFDSSWFLPTDSYAFIYFGINDEYFPENGVPAAVYCKNIDYFNSKTSFDQLYTQMTSSQYISSGTVDSWFKSYTDYLSTTSTAPASELDPATKYPTSEANFVSLLYDFVTNQTEGLRHAREVVFTASNTDIDGTYISFTHVNLDGSSKQIEAMDATQKMISNIFTGGECFAYGRRYLTFETNKVIQNELYRNLGIASGCVFIVTLVLIAHLWTSLMVFTCVIATLVDVGGMMHFWGLTIDTVTCIQLILAIGLAVDYSAHIGHCFMTFTGCRNDRVKATLVEIGAPVFSGGFSTFLAFVMLAGSNSYVFTTFFKIFFLVVVFGLFHGLAYLPTILSWLGPSPYLSADKRYTDDDELKEIQPGNSSGGTTSSGGTDNSAFQRNNEPPPDYEEVVDIPYIPPPDYTPPPSRKSNGKVWESGKITPVDT